MKARLLATSGPWQGTAYEIADEAVLGRGEESTIRLDDKAISTRHARIGFDVEEECYFLEDLESLNGTLLDGIPVRGRERLGRLHVVTLAERFDLVFRALDVAAPAETTELPPAAAAEAGPAPAAGEDGGTVIDREIPVLPEVLRAAADGGEPAAAEAESGPAPPDAAPDDGTRIEELPVELPAELARMADGGAAAEPEPEPAPGGEARPASTSAAPAPAFHLEVLAGGGPGKRYPLRDGPNRVGRSQAADVWIDSPHVSRRHAVLTVAEGKVWLRDEGSRNASQIDGVPITAEVEVPPGSVLRFGNVEARLVPPAASAETTE